MSRTAEFNQAENPYRSTMAASWESVPDFAGDSQETLLRSFVGSKADFYLQKWASRLADPNGEVGINWSAMLMTVLWFAYRKMYAVATVLAGGLMLQAVGLELLFIFLTGKASPPAISIIINLVVAIVCGLYANAWYLKHAQKAIATTQAQGARGDELLFVLSKRGGSSMLAVFAAMFLSFVAMIVAGLMMALVIVAFYGRI